MQLSIVIPCLNEAKTIVKAVKFAHEALQLSNIKGEVIVADNGSTDGSRRLVEKQGLAKLVLVPIRGYGAALHWGILNANGNYVLYGDADLSYDFFELSKFTPYIKKNFDLVLGSRFKGKIDKGAMPWSHRYIGTPVLSFLIRLIYSIPVSDSNSGMRLIKKEFYHGLKMKNAGMEWASELLIKTSLSKTNYLYAEVPISLHKDERGRSPHLISWSDGWRHLKAVVLLKPDILFIPVFLFSIFSIFLFPKFLTVALIILLTSFGLLLSAFAAKILRFSIDTAPSFLASQILKFPLVLPTIILNLSFIPLSLFGFIKNSHTTFFIWSAIIIFDLWLFFIETIKTLTINRLPDKI